MNSTYDDARELAINALEWYFAQLSDDSRLKSLPRAANAIPLHVLVRETLAVVADRNNAVATTEEGDDAILDRELSTAELRKVRAALEFSYARVLDVAQADPVEALDGTPTPLIFEPSLRKQANVALESTIDLLMQAVAEMPHLEELSRACEEHLASGIESQLHCDWVVWQRDTLLAFVERVQATAADARQMAAKMTFDAPRRVGLPFPSLAGLPRREQQRLLIADALLLHEEFALSETEIGTIWANAPRDRAEAKRLGGKLLARARKSRAEHEASNNKVRLRSSSSIS